LVPEVKFELLEKEEFKIHSAGGRMGKLVILSVLKVKFDSIHSAGGRIGKLKIVLELEEKIEVEIVSSWTHVAGGRIGRVKLELELSDMEMLMVVEFEMLN